MGSPGEQGREKDRGPRTPSLTPWETELGDLCGKQPRRWWVPKAEGRRCPEGKGDPPLSVPGAAGKSVHLRTVASSQGPTGPAREGSKWAWSGLLRVRCAVNAEMRLFEGVLPPRERGDGIWSAERENLRRGLWPWGQWWFSEEMREGGVYRTCLRESSSRGGTDGAWKGVGGRWQWGPVQGRVQVGWPVGREPQFLEQ